MKPIDPAELSGLLDNELSPTRAAEVRAAIAADPALRQEFEQLAQLHATWSTQAASAAFHPHPFALPGTPWPTPLLALGVAALLLIRFLPKFLPLWPGAILQFTACIVLLIWIIAQLNRLTADIVRLPPPGNVAPQ